MKYTQLYALQAIDTLCVSNQEIHKPSHSEKTDFKIRAAQYIANLSQYHQHLYRKELNFFSKAVKHFYFGPHFG